MPTTISTSVTGPVVLGTADNPLYVTSSGSVTSTGSGADGIDGGSGTTWTISNAGKISSASNAGISLGGSGVVSNSGSISGADAVDLQAGGKVTNLSGGSISSTGSSGVGVYIRGAVGTLTNSGGISAVKLGVLASAGGSVSNTQSGSITAGDIGVFLQNQAGTVTNAGFISGTGTQGTGVYLENNGNITNTSTGTITGQIFGAFIEGGFGTLANYGSISGAAYDGVILGLGGVITNAAGASISSVNNGIYVKYRASGTVTNSGTVSASGTGGAGIDLADGGLVTNNSTGTISGNAFGVFAGSTAATGSAVATISNAGNILGVSTDGVDLVKGGSITNMATGTITGGSNGVHVNTGASGTVTNSGNITATGTAGAGVDLGDGGSVTNNTGGSISGGGFGVFATGALGTVTNNASISGSHGVGFAAGGSVTNNASGTITGQVAGVQVLGAAGTLVNTGHVSATAGAGADIEGGGSVTNNAGGNITGSTFGVFMSGGASTVTNAGTITGTNDAVDFVGTAANRLIVDPGAVFVGNVVAAGFTNTLELASGTGTISGIGTDSFSNFQTLEVDLGGVWTLAGANTAPTVLDDGTLSIAGLLDATTALDPTSSGLFQLQTGGTLEVAAATGAGTQVKFLGSSELIVDSVSSFGTNVGTPSYVGTQLQDFASGDKIDLKDFSSTGVIFSYNSSTGVLQLSNGASQVASLEFQTSSLGSMDFQATSDGASGTFITTVLPVLKIENPSLRVPAGGSVALGITVTPFDSDDTVSVTISGVPQGFENIIANNGGQPVSHHGGNYTFTEAEVNSGLTLVSSYKGHGQPVNTLTVTASNTTAGETGTSAAQTITVTDPPATVASTVSDLIPFAPSAPVGHLAALFDQFAAPGFHNSGSAGQIASLLDPHGSGPVDLRGDHHG